LLDPSFERVENAGIGALGGIPVCLIGCFSCCFQSCSCRPQQISAQMDLIGTRRRGLDADKICGGALGVGGVNCGAFVPGGDALWSSGGLPGLPDVRGSKLSSVSLACSRQTAATRQSAASGRKLPIQQRSSAACCIPTPPPPRHQNPVFSACLDLRCIAVIPTTLS
jgi:hypothetical protein